MESLIHAFPDDHHLRTIELFLTTCSDLHNDVDVNSIVSQYVSRLAEFASKNPESVPALDPKFVDLFTVFSHHVSEITAKRKEIMGPSDVICLCDALLAVVFKCFPDRLDYVDQVLGHLPNHADTSGNPECFRTSSTISRQLLALLKLPVEEYNDLTRIAKLSNYSLAMSLLPAFPARQLARALADSAVSKKLIPSDLPKEEVETWVQSILGLVVPLYNNKEVDEEDIMDDAVLLSKMIHSFDGVGDSSVQLEIVNQIYEILKKSGDLRLRVIIPSLVLVTLHAARTGCPKEVNENQQESDETTESQEDIQEEEDQIEDPLDLNSQKTSVDLANDSPTRAAIRLAMVYCEIMRDLDPKLSLSILSQVALIAASLDEITLSYDSMAQVLLIFEREPLGDSRKQLDVFRQIVATLVALKLPQEFHQTLASRTTQLHSQLLLRPDQCSALVLCSHLFENIDEDRILEVLKRAFKMADKCMETQVDVSLLVAILERFLYHFERFGSKGEARITSTHINGILSLVASNLPEDPSGQSVFDNVKAHIEARKSDTKYAEIYAEISTDV
ncbi:hypothetical protein GEMRC1_001895 [Eukaryota sp. GEM-RC1]